MFLLLPLLFNQHPLGSPDLCVYLLVYTRLCLEIQSPGLMIVLTQKPLLWQMNYCWIATHSSLKYSESKAEEGSWVMDRMYRWEGGSRVMGKAPQLECKTLKYPGSHSSPPFWESLFWGERRLWILWLWRRVGDIDLRGFLTQSRANCPKAASLTLLCLAVAKA